MKNDDIFEALGSVDPEYISESAPKNKKNKGLILKILIPAAALIAIIVAVTTVAAMTRGQEEPGGLTGGVPENADDGYPDGNKGELTEAIGTKYYDPSVSGNQPPVNEIYLNSLEEYEEFVSKNQLPDWFVKYENIREIAEFGIMRVVNFTDASDGFETFSSVDKNGYGFRIEILPYLTLDDAVGFMERDYPADQFPDHHQIVEYENAYYVWNEYGDHYYDVSRIFIQTDKCLCCFFGAFYRYREPVEYSDTFIARLLDPDSAQDAIDQFIALLEKE